MTELAVITLENEMDLSLAYKRSILTAGMLGLTVSTQTAFATAVSEVCREVIDKGTNGIAKLGALADQGRFFITAYITCEVDADFNRQAEGFEYARKLLPVVELTVKGDLLHIELKLSIPRSTHIDHSKVAAVKRQIQADGPVSAYEEVKQRNAVLSDINQQQEVALLAANYLDQQKNEFLSVASHELNSPLTVLRSYAQIALKILGEADHPLKKPLVKIDQQSLKLVSLITQLMDITKIERGDIAYDRRLVDLNVFLSDALDAAQLLTPHHDLRIELGEAANVMIDPLRIEQVLNNLISNAAKYSSLGSAIIIKTTVSHDFVTCEVHDHGIGMLEDTQRKVFEKFYRSKDIEKKYSGLGMGLYIASRIISDHGGNITVSSEHGVGSVFAFSLPLSKV